MKDEAAQLAGPVLYATTGRLLGACATTLAPLGGALALLAAAALLVRTGALAGVATLPPGGAPTLVSTVAPLAASGITPAAAPVVTAALFAVLLLMPIERVLALRVRFDAGLFADLAADAAQGAARLDTLDHALHTLGLRPRAAAARPLADRVRGARRLALQHAVVVALQALAAGGALAAAWLAMPAAGAC